ncbi:MAG: 16S rRNA (uracil(1498)-N(3))-methyltransferase [Alphaproteobacteria bacterium]|nr:16S rRNA (uracil(1498)-N(3))-methyltransferase [Alphaproteobacteria bacterium]
MSATPRLFVEADLAAGGTAELSSDQAHYLGRVMRLGPGDAVKLFNGRDGEFECRLDQVGKSAAVVQVIRQTRPQVTTPDIWLLFAPLKKTRTDFVVEKATELGVRVIWPVLTERCEAQAVRTDRLSRIAIEAAEQTERMGVPEVRRELKLVDVVANWKPERTLLFCDEMGEAPLLSDAVAGAASAAILIGPEGGFSPDERKLIRNGPGVRPATLGPRILRAETAAVAALTLWQAAVGDWRNP